MGKYSVEAARARRRKQAAAQAKKDRERWEKIRKPLLYGACGLAAVLVIWWIVSIFYVPANGVRVWNGATVGVEDNWLVANLGTSSKKAYFHLGNMDQPDGYTKDPDYATTTDSNNKIQYFLANDENAAIHSVYATGVGGYTAEAMCTRLKSNGYFMTTSEVTNKTIAGKNCYMLVGTIQSTDDDGNAIENVGVRTIYCYVDSIRDSSVAIALTTNSGNVDELPTEEELIAQLDTFLPYLTVVK